LGERNSDELYGITNFVFNDGGFLVGKAWMGHASRSLFHFGPAD
jgi:hypothetical protein